jgi:hypothetical protein
MIERHGGVLDDIWDTKHGPARRYRIKIGEPCGTAPRLSCCPDRSSGGRDCAGAADLPGGARSSSPGSVEHN